MHASRPWPSCLQDGSDSGWPPTWPRITCPATSALCSVANEGGKQKNVSSLVVFGKPSNCGKSFKIGPVPASWWVNEQSTTELPTLNTNGVALSPGTETLSYQALDHVTDHRIGGLGSKERFCILCDITALSVSQLCPASPSSNSSLLFELLLVDHY